MATIDSPRLVKHDGNGVNLTVQVFTTPDIEPRPAGVRITTERTIEPSKFGDVLVAALEGGSNYWIDRIGRKDAPPGNSRARVVYHSDWIALGGTLVIRPEDDPKDCVLTLDHFAMGCLAAAKYTKRDLKDFLEDHDANDADLALQFALFNEIVYG